ncbi:MAG: glycoside hydrolase domain-containing protein, partial [Acidobacteriota bacterium]
MVTAAAAVAIAVLAAQGTENVQLHRAPTIPNVIDGVVFEPGNWTPHLKAGEKGLSWGNHRAVVELDPQTGSMRGADAVLVTIPWRRHDPKPDAKAIVVVNARTSEPIANALAARVENASGDIIFEPQPGSTTYYVYYMPWQSSGGPYPMVTYPSSVLEPAATWVTSVRARRSDQLPRGRTTRIQSVDAFHSFFPMEIIATDPERARFMASPSEGWRVIAEHRDYPIRMRRYLP